MIGCGRPFLFHHAILSFINSVMLLFGNILVDSRCLPFIMLVTSSRVYHN